LYICICNGITERQVRDCAHGGARTIEDLGWALGVGTNCGRCRDCASELLSDVHGLESTAGDSGGPERIHP
jgi:bacterioferritin-associated ferredoxin